ncbi:hypothetical protein BZA05DRAFT_444215 [Tricharina praecox]|uniref:uncharacterized protein n=1 Tax=Tricharina praecox TaxID=43433 RepID=UPI00221E6315|nr:uncharacterized protein BZA05DRAFT_444215 [Tricharina praecox]KAI5853948.1 hypothetical protein BZA05DRAFT_444215 [Tricharina praecox]
MSPKPPTEFAPSLPPKLSRPSGILKTTKPKPKTPAAATTIKAATIKTATTTSSTFTVTTATTVKADNAMFDTLIERLESFGAEPVPSQRMLSSLANEGEIDEQIEMAENSMLCYELKGRQKQLR